MNNIENVEVELDWSDNNNKNIEIACFVDSNKRLFTGSSEFDVWLFDEGE